MTACSVTDILSVRDAPAESVEDVRSDRLALAARSGNEAAFQSLMEQFQTGLHRFCWRLLDCEEDARDAAQETFVKAWFALEHYEPRGKFSPWLFRIALNLCRDKAKSRAGRQKQKTISLQATPAHQVCCEQRDPAEISAHQGDLEKLRQGLACLPEKLRLPQILCGMEGLSQKDAAIVMGCSIRAVEGRLRRGREVLEAWWRMAAT